MELVDNTVEFALLVSAELGTVQSNIGTLIKEGLGPRADVDHLLARDTCLALAKLSTKVACLELLSVAGYVASLTEKYCTLSFTGT